MSYQVLARKYRPQKFSDVIGQDHVTRTLRNAIEQGRIAHGYIFSGHRGIGKTTIARILAMALNCRSQEHPVPEPCGVCDSCREIRAGNSVDVIEIDAATNRGIDEIRELRDAARYRPARDRYKIWILDEAHQITDAAFNALLKTLEEPPGHVVFMMATTQPEDIPQTIRSRCQHFSFHAVRFDDIVQQLRDIATKEGVSADDAALSMLAEVGDGSMRDALSIMDQAIACCGATLSSEMVRGLVGTVSSDVLEEILRAVAANSSPDVLRRVDRILVEGQSAQHFARQMVRFLRNALVAKVAGSDSQVLQISSDERARVAAIAELFSEEELSRFLQIMLRTHNDLSYKQEQRFHLELGLLKLVHAQRLLPLEELLSGEAAKPGSAGASGGSRKVAGAPPGAAPRPAAPARTASQPVASAPASPFAKPSPFESDRSRKSEASAAAAPLPMAGVRPEPVAAVSTSGAYATAPAAIGTAVAVEPEPPAAPEPSPAQAEEVSLDALREVVLSALENAGQQVLAHNLEQGEWSQRGIEISAKVAMSQAMVDFALGEGPKRIIQKALTETSGQPLKFKMVSGGAQFTAQAAAPRQSNRNGGSARSRAMNDPVVKRMQEAFGAEVRTVIDLKERG
jgi:DNA polymerase-3 subunit gamma/tau